MAVGPALRVDGQRTNISEKAGAALLSLYLCIFVAVLPTTESNTRLFALRRKEQ